MANPDGLVLNFRIHTGSDNFSDVKGKLGLAAKAVLCLAKSVKEKSIMHCDRSFTSILLAKELLKKKIYFVGRVMKNRVNPLSCIVANSQHSF